ncbi:DUF4157 domain-containing protein [Streptomyces sp. NBC_00094]|uniref:eCIS core domain-containing protein n=1 Tax=Streptomyces sp. NBC_00094 TaxID=2903620 RepID=UPI00225BF72E|nr:DUF4157 domain-containing protein [Streptomyces sp. NBC_00094]MCX5393976.1 DUF4157 domain-containing protein [Streptomyces sp. NBC_00094]
MARENGRTPDPERSSPTPVRAPLPGAGERNIQGTAGNTAMVQMLRQAGHPWSRPAPPEQHQHGAGCGHLATPQAGTTDEAAVQRSTVHGVLRAPGRPLDDTTRADMETRLGADFTDVRIHDDSAARASAAEVGARAYTSGSHVVIGAGGADKHTLAHELTHVIQQRQGPVAGTDRGDGLSVSDPSDRFEREAEANATRVMRAPVAEAGAPASLPSARDTSHTAAVQRMPFNGKEKKNAPPPPPPKQGDHLFNKLAEAAELLATNATTRMETVFAGLGRPVRNSLGQNAAAFREKRDAFTTKRDEMLLKASEAKRERHPKSHPKSLFFAAEGVSSQAGGDDNSQTFGTFSATLSSLPALCGVTADGAVRPLALPAEVTAARGGWENLKGRVYDSDAERRVTAALKDIEKGRHRRAFGTWNTDTQGIYAELYELMLSTVEALQELTATMIRGGVATAAAAATDNGETTNSAAPAAGNEETESHT